MIPALIVFVITYIVTVGAARNEKNSEKQHSDKNKLFHSVTVPFEFSFKTPDTREII